MIARIGRMMTRIIGSYTPPPPPAPEYILKTDGFFLLKNDYGKFERN